MSGTDTLLTNATLATMTGGGAPYGLAADGALVAREDRFQWLGPAARLPAEFMDLPAEDLEGRVGTHALIDCHSHLVYGKRAREFDMRLEGATYEETARAGGEILSTVRATREASESEPIDAALDGETGTLEAGKAADLAVWNVGHPSELAYYLGLNPLERRIYKGGME